MNCRTRNMPLVLGAAVILGVMNAVMGHVNSFIVHLPLFLDTIGTLISTALFGLLPGIITAVVTHIVPDIVPIMRGGYLPWTVCSISSSVILWLFIRNDAFETMLHVVLVVIAVTIANAVTGSIVAVFFFSGITGHPVDYLVTGFLYIGQSVASAAFWARIPINLVDKGLAVLIAFLLYRWQYRREAAEETP